MPVIKEAFEIPADIALGLLDGQFVRNGGVVRIAKGFEGAGEKVKHLKPIDIPEQELAAIAKKAMPIAKARAWAPKVFIANHKVIIIIGVVAFVVTITALIIYLKKRAYPNELRNVQQKLNDYIAAIANNNVDFLVVDQLAKAIDELKALKNYKKYKIQLTADELSTIIGQLSQYTQDMASDNNYVCSESENKLLLNTGDFVFDLRNYLEIQKNIIVNAA